MTSLGQSAPVAEELNHYYVKYRPRSWGEYERAEADVIHSTNTFPEKVPRNPLIVRLSQELHKLAKLVDQRLNFSRLQNSSIVGFHGLL